MPARLGHGLYRYPKKPDENHRTKMSEFGDLLRAYRLKCRDPHSGGPLTQARLAELLGLETAVEGYSGATVSNWERGRHQIRRDNRQILVGLVKVLQQCGGVQTREEGDQLLLKGNYRALNENEVRQINTAWQRVWAEEAGPSRFPAAEEQEAMLPPPSYTHLFGVEEARDRLLAQLLLPRSPYLLVIVGLGGLGKTALADTVARRAIELGEFAQVIWFLADGRQTESLEDPTADSLFQLFIQAMSQQLVPGGIQERNPTRQLARVRNEFKRHRHLVIIDSVENPTALNSLLVQLNALTGPSKFLLTARHHPAPETNAYIFPLPELTAEDTLALLRYQAETSGVDGFEQLTDAELSGIYRLIGGHPLALRLIPRLARMHSLPDIQAEWRQGQTGYIADMYNAIYEALWQQLQAAERQLLQVMPLIAPVGATAGHLRAISGLSAHFGAALTKLGELCLIEPRGTAGERRFGIHSLTGQFLQSRRAGEKDGEALTKSILANVAYWQQHLGQLPDPQWYTLDNGRANIFRAIQYSLNLPQEEVTPALKAQWQELSELLFRYVERRGYTQEWIPLQASLAEKFAADPKARCQLLNRLGELYGLIQQFPKAIEIHQRVVQAAQQAEDELEIARAYFNLGKDYFGGRQYEIAAEQGRIALEMFTHLGFSGRETAATLNLLGTITQAQKKFDVSEHYLTQAASLWRQLNHAPELARILNNLALTLQEQEKVEEAFACYAEARAALAKTTSELDRILIYLSEGTLYFNLQRYPEAEATFKKINLTFLKEAGHLLYQALTLNNLGNIAFVQGEYNQAEKHLRECVLLWQQMGDEVETSDTLGVVADVVAATGDVGAAIALYEEALAVLSQYPDDLRARQPAEKIRKRLKSLGDKGKGTNQVVPG